MLEELRSRIHGSGNVGDRRFGLRCQIGPVVRV